MRAIWPLDIDQEAANDGRYDLKAAARMMGGLAVDQAKTVLAKIQALPAGGPLALGPLSEDAADLMREHVSELPAIQGYLLAALLREHQKNDNDRIDPGVILDRKRGQAQLNSPPPGSSGDSAARQCRVI